MNTVLESDVIARSSATTQSRADLYRPALDNLMLSLSKYEVVALALRQAQGEGSDRQAVTVGGRNTTGQPRIKSAYDVMELGTVIARSCATKQSRADLHRPALDNLMLSLSKYEVVALALRQAQGEGSDRQAVAVGGRNTTGQPRIKSALDCFTLRARNDSLLPWQIQSVRKMSDS